MARLRHYRLCPASRGIRLLAAEIGFAVTLEEERPWEWRAEFLALNPAGELPVLTDDEGGVLAAGAGPVAEYLSEVAGKGGDESDPPAYVSAFPGDAGGRAEVRRIAAWFAIKMHREVTQTLLDEKIYSRFRTGYGGAPDADLLRAVRKDMAYHLRYLEHLAAARTWLAGDALSYADFAAAGQISVVDYLHEIVWDGHEAAKLWYARMKSRPAMREILSERVPGASPPPKHYDDPDF